VHQLGESRIRIDATAFCHCEHLLTAKAALWPGYQSWSRKIVSKSCLP